MVHGKPDAPVFWLVCHGYGQLPEYFIQPFLSLPPEHRVAAPEGPHTFYLEGFSGRVGAHWMTSHHREQDIHNYLCFLRSAADRWGSPAAKRIAFGFSQGCHTACRMVMDQPDRWDALVLWGGFFPQDAMGPAYLELWHKKPVYWFTGDQDEYMDAGRLKKARTWLQTNLPEVYHLPYRGKHKVDQDVLVNWVGHTSLFKGL